MRGCALKLKRSCSAVLAALVLMSVIALPAMAQMLQESSQATRFNVMLVIDGSGSLVSDKNGTDKTGLRYDAIDLFLALLTNDGNHVGAIVFDDNSEEYILNTGVGGITGKTEKEALSDRIRQAGTGNDTDIGSALLSAVEQLDQATASNGMDSVVILFSDGRTDLGNNEKAYEASLANKEAAITLAQEKEIPIYGICLAATSVAEPAELEEISSRTSAECVTINSPDQLSEAFEQFYRLIFSTSSAENENLKFDANGDLSFDIVVPSYGAEEINVIVDTDGEQLSVNMTAPSGKINEQKLDDMTMIAGDYKVVKAVSPEAGTWTVQLNGEPNSSVRINIIYNVDTSAVLELKTESPYLAEQVPFGFEISLYRDGAKIMDEKVAHEYKGQMILTDQQSGAEQEVVLTADGACFRADVSGLKRGSYVAQAHLNMAGVSISTNQVMLYIDNTPPATTVEGGYKTVKKVVTPLTGRSYSEDLSKSFSDEQEGTLQYEILSSQLVKDTVQLDGSTLQVNTAKSRSGDVVIQAIDSSGASAELTIHFKVTNLTLPIFIGLCVGILVAVVVAVTGYLASRPMFKGTITCTDATDGPYATGRQHAGFRGKLKLSYFGVGGSGFNPNKCYFQPGRGGRISFCANVPFYVNGMEQKQINLFEGDNYIYADQEQTRGLCITVRN